MFWKKKNKLPVTLEDKNWVDDNINWLRNELSEEHFLSIETVTPTEKYFSENYNDAEKNAEYFLSQVMQLMDIKDLEVELIFFSDDNFVEMDDGRVLTTNENEEGSYQSALGIYEMNEKGFKIYIERKQLKDPMSLIATISHELSHEILLGENRIDENDEYLTDLTAIVYGFGIFLGNTKFNFKQYSNNGFFGWQSSKQGYLPEQVIAYAMAKLSFEREEEVSYSKYLNKSMKEYFDKSIKWLHENNGQKIS